MTVDSEPQRSPPLRRSPNTAERGLLPGTDIGTHSQLPAWKLGQRPRAQERSRVLFVGSARIRNAGWRRQASTVSRQRAVLQPEVLEDRFRAQAFSPQADAAEGFKACKGLAKACHGCVLDLRFTRPCLTASGASRQCPGHAAS